MMSAEIIWFHPWSCQLARGGPHERRYEENEEAAHVPVLAGRSAGGFSGW
eukprot:SAG22_NODE_261_length_13373_cov_17.745472_15_plen_50_part_00